MVHPRVAETKNGIQGEFAVEVYDQMQKRLRDKGWLETDAVITSGISHGLVLEIGPGPGYLGLEWLKKTQGTALKGLDISADMIALARRNAIANDLSSRAEYVHGNCANLPFADGTFEAVFTTGSLHEWEEPQKVFNEIWRVLKTGGRLWVSDFRRDMSQLVKLFLMFNAKPKEIRKGLITSLGAAYTADELKGLLQATSLNSFKISGGLMSLNIVGIKK